MFYRRKLRLPWAEGVSNEEVLLDLEIIKDIIMNEQKETVKTGCIHNKEREH